VRKQHLVIVALLCMAVTSVSYGVTTYTDRPSWVAAVGGVFGEETFSDSTLNPGISVTSSAGGGLQMLVTLHLHHAQETGRARLDPVHVAQGGDLDAGVATDLEDRLALEAFDDATVHLEADRRRGLRTLRRLRGEQSLGEEVGVGRSGDQFGHGVRPQWAGAAEVTASG
jgi:hypothetical protein